MIEAFLTCVKFRTEVLGLWLAFFQAVVRDTEIFYLGALSSFLWLSRFQGLSLSSWGRMARARVAWVGSLYEPGLAGHASPPAISHWWKLSHIVIVTAKCKGCQEIPSSCVPRTKREQCDKQLAHLCHALDLVGERVQQSKCVGTGMSSLRDWASTMKHFVDTQ